MPYLPLAQMSGSPLGISNLHAVILLLIVTPLLFCLGKVIYNLYFHPLRKYPGPFLARASSLWYVYHSWIGDFAHVVLAAHEQYGEVIRTTPNDLDYTLPQAWRDIFGHRHGIPENDKDQRHLMRDTAEEHIINASRENHAAFRRLLSNGFSDKALREQQPTVARYVDLLLQRLHEQSAGGDAPLNIVDWLNFATFDIIGDLAFSEPFNCLSEANYHPWVKMIFATVHAAGLFFAVNRLGVGTFLTALLKRIAVPRDMVAKRASNVKLVNEKLMRRLESEPAYTDLMHNMVAAYRGGDGKGQQLSVGELSANGRVLIVAGSETTATLLSGAVYFLGRNARAQTRLAAEVRGRFSSEADMTFASVSELPYLMAVLDESLRMFPPIASSLIRVTPPEGANICGDWVPGGTSVSITFLAMNYSERNFKDAKGFHPERFLAKGGAHRNVKAKNGAGAEMVVEDRDDEWAGDRKDALQPFSFGPRNCIGRNLAYMEMRLILARIVWSFDLELEPGTKDYTKQRTFGIWEKKPLMVRLKPVKRDL